MAEKLRNFKVETTEGEAVEVTCNVETKGEHLMKNAMLALSIEPGGATYELVINGKILDPNLKIEEYNIPEDGVILLQRRAKVG